MVFAYIPDNVHVKRPIQIVYIVNSNENILIQPRNVISIGDNASVSIVHCDDSLETKETLINTVTEIYVGKAAQCDYFKLENKDNQTTLINHLLIHQEGNSTVNTNTTVFNGGLVHNTIAVNLTEPKAEINSNGLYLVDKNKTYRMFCISNIVQPNVRAISCIKELLTIVPSTFYRSCVCGKRCGKNGSTTNQS